MKIFCNSQVITRFLVIACLFVVIGLAILAKAGYLMFVQHDFWREVNERFVRDSLKVFPHRGNILSADGQLLATSLPEYKICLDFMVVEKDSVRRAKYQHERDSLLMSKLDSIAIGLNRILPDKSVGWFRERICEGRERKKQHWILYPKRISFMDYQEIRKLPFFNRGTIKSGFHADEFDECKKPFGSLAAHTIGNLSRETGAKEMGRPTSGLQLAYDTLLRGQEGYVHRQKVRNRWLPFVDKQPVNGADIVTTLDVRMQDFCEKALVDKLKEINAMEGVAILMEVKTGDIKAIVNMNRCSDGVYRELRTQAVSNLMEPGSVFKPMAFMVAFEDNKIKMTDYVDACHGEKLMYGRKMRDHNRERGGYGMLSIPECLEFSSNVGVSTVIDKYYHDNPEKFVDGIYKIGVAEDLHLDLPSYVVPRIRRPKKDGSNWSKTALAWMSIGYETQIPPISVLNFYNGVANNGKMMRPRLVTAAMRNGQVIHEYPTQVVREQMCSPQALKNIQTCLEWVVSKGLGKKAGSKHFKVSGKTGTAQVWGKGGFSYNYLVTFAGYFPSDAPKYSCIVCILKHGAPASGGGQCGPVFKKIAEMAMAESARNDANAEADTMHQRMPQVCQGNLLYANRVLDELNIKSIMNRTTSSDDCVWGTTTSSSNKVEMHEMETAPDRVGNYIGMGARDAVYMAEQKGLRVKIHGVGRVTRQNLPESHLVKRGETLVLDLTAPKSKSDAPPPPVYLPPSAPADTVRVATISSAKPQPKATEKKSSAKQTEKPVTKTQKVTKSENASPKKKQ